MTLSRYTGGPKDGEEYEVLEAPEREMEADPATGKPHPYGYVRVSLVTTNGLTVATYRCFDVPAGKGEAFMRGEFGTLDGK